MAGLFGRAAPTQSRTAPAAYAPPRRGLFGGGGGGVDLGRIAMFINGGTQGLAADRERAKAEALARQQRFAEDRLRAQLSPADGPNGSGTGAAPSIEAQMAALDEASLLNPAAAQRFAPVVQSRRMAGLTQNLPLEQRLAIELNPEQAGQSFASQFKDETLAAGSIRTRGNQAVIGAPRVERFDDRWGTYNPVTGEAGYTDPRGPTFQEQTGRITAERPQIASLSPGQQAFGVDPYGNAAPLAENSTPTPPNAQQLETQGAIDTNTREVLPTLNTMRQALQSGDVITGLAADARLQAARLAAAAGNEDAKRQVAATENYRNMSGRLRVGMAKTLGANPSNADIILLEKITAGDIGQSAASLLATLDQGLEFANRRTEDLTNQLGQYGAQARPAGAGSPPPPPGFVLD